MNGKKDTMMRKRNDRQEEFALTAPTATSVQLVGDFTHWKDHPIDLSRNADGVWRATVPLRPGTHRYRFLVDGQWRDDPTSPAQVPNPFGSRDAIRRVG